MDVMDVIDVMDVMDVMDVWILLGTLANISILL